MPFLSNARWSVEIRTGEPEVAPGLRGTGTQFALGGLEINRTRRGLVIQEQAIQRSVTLSAAEALDLLAFLREQEAQLSQMAAEDARVIEQAQWRDRGGAAPSGADDPA